MDITNLDTRPAGYDYIMKSYQLSGIPNWHISSVSSTNTHSIQDGRIHEVFKNQYWPGDTICDHLEFALKYDGVNLSLLFQIFKHLSPEVLTEYIKSKPTGKYARRIWFLYEFLMNVRLSVDDISSGNYVEALEPEKYFTIVDGIRSQRHRIINNLIGPVSFCPVIRRTNKLLRIDAADIRKKCEVIFTSYSPEILRRALNYLYRKETKSSFEIEHINPDSTRTEKFIALLEQAEKKDFCNKMLLIELQNLIVDSRFANGDYRDNQNYVGHSITYQKEMIHFISPKPEDLASLMSGLIESHKRMQKGSVSAVVHAAVIAYGFVFLHPFDDGNGRIHRFLIHNILSLQGMLPQGLMFPVSAVMLKSQHVYDASLEAFSKPLLQLIQYRLDQMGQMTVENETKCWYQYMDMTAQAEALYEFVNMTIESELVEELNFLYNYDRTKNAIQEIIDMPDQLIDLFIKCCLQNNGKLSSRKRSDYFNFLSDEELAEMEMAVRSGYDREL